MFFVKVGPVGLSFQAFKAMQKLGTEKLSKNYTKHYDEGDTRFPVKHEHEPEFVYVKDERDLNDMDDCSTVIPVRISPRALYYLQLP